MYVVFNATEESPSEAFGLDYVGFKTTSRAIELAYLTDCNEEHITWMLMGELDIPESYALGYVQAGIAIKQGRAYITKNYTKG